MPPVFDDADAAQLAIAARVHDLRGLGRAPVIVAVDGPSGSGKTTLGTLLGARLDAPVVHMDDIYPGWDGLAEAVGLVTTQVLEPLREGRGGGYRRWDWVRNVWRERVEVPYAPVVVLEGVASSVGSAGALVDVPVWVQAPRDVRMARGIERDGEAYRPHWERWARQEQAVFTADDTRERAFLILDTTHLPAAT